MGLFKRPVPPEFLIIRHFGESGQHYTQHIHEATGLWLNAQICGTCKLLSPCGCAQPDPYGQHCGYDFACPVGTEVKAIADGLIIRTGLEDSFECEKGKGFRIVQMVSKIDFDTWTIVYRHLQGTNSYPGTKLKTGDRIGFSGDIGFGVPFLHVELLNKDMQCVPIDFDDGK